MAQMNGSQPKIPVIDVSGLFEDDKALRALAAEISTACRDVGFFYIVNHGIPASLRADVFRQARAFFNLPHAEKDKINIHKSKYMRGYFGQGADKSDGIVGDIKEGFDLAADLPEDNEYVKAKLPFYGPNVWPENPPGFRPALNGYHGSMLALGLSLLKAFAVSLDMPRDYFEDKFVCPMAQIRVLRYPPQPSVNQRAIGAGEHTDFGWITMIAHDETPGLQVLGRDDRWIDVDPLPNAFVVNVGDLMSRWTNDFYTATLHRVVNRNAVDRYSVAFFMDPDYYAEVSCLPTCVSESRPARYSPIVVGDYMNRRFHETTTFREGELDYHG